MGRKRALRAERGRSVVGGVGAETREAKYQRLQGRHARGQRPFVRHYILKMTFSANMAEHRCTCYIKSLEKSRKKKNTEIKLVKNMRLRSVVKAGFVTWEVTQSFVLRRSHALLLKFLMTFEQGASTLNFALSPVNYVAGSVCSEEIQRNDMYIIKKLNVVINQGDKNGIIKTCQFIFIKLAKW